jgi:hypothetical protein
MQQNNFMRLEAKYLADFSQARRLIESLGGMLKEGPYGHYAVSSIYYDTDDFRLARASIEKPAYKEKLRLRAYGRATDESVVFAELKKKFNGTVYKRRASLPYWEARRLLEEPGKTMKGESQIVREIAHFASLLPLKPKALVQCGRDAYEGEGGLRITLDRGIRFRTEAVGFGLGQGGSLLLGAEQALIEIKCEGAIPFALARALSQAEIFPTSFSKYGEGYKRFVAAQWGREMGGRKNA